MRLLLFNLVTDADHPILGFTSQWIEELALRMEWVEVICVRKGRVAVPRNVRVHSIGRESGRGKVRALVEFYKYLLRVVREGRIDVCFSHMNPNFSILAAPVLKLRGIPLVTWYVHGRCTWQLKLAHRLSSRMVSSFPQSYPYKHDKLSVVGHGISMRFFSEDSEAELRADAEPMILCVGRLSPIKDHLTLLRAVRLLKRTRTCFRVGLVGGPGTPSDDTYVLKLKEEIKRLNLGDRVSIYGPVVGTALPQWYHRCTVHVNLTPLGFFDKVALEAMACGRPCLFANAAFRETAGRYGDQLYFPPGDADMLARLLAQILAMSSKDRENMGSYLRQRVLECHSLRGLGGRLVELFETLRP